MSPVGRTACFAETSTKRPRPLALSAAWKARLVCWTVRTSSPSRNVQSSSGASAIPLPPRQPPTACTSPSTRPKRSCSAAAQRRRGGRVEQVGRRRVDPLGRQVELLHERVELVLRAVGEREHGALVGERAGDERPERAAGPCERDDAAFERERSG